MTYDEYQEQVSQYIDGELSDGESERLFKHLSGCAECRSFLRSTLELRSKIHDEMLMEVEITSRAMPSRFTSAFTLPLVALLTAFFLFLGISQLSSPYPYNAVSSQTEVAFPQPALPSNPF